MGSLFLCSKTTLQLEKLVSFFFAQIIKEGKEIIVVTTKGIFSPKIIGIVKGHHAQSQSEIVEKGLSIGKNDRL